MSEELQNQSEDAAVPDAPATEGQKFTPQATEKAPPSKKKRRTKGEYTSEDHRRAFEAYRQRCKFVDAAKAIGGHPAADLTARAWSRADFRCTYGCPYHGWEELVGELSSKERAHLVPLEVRGVTQVKNNYPKTREDRLNEVFRSDIEHLIHWEILYAKLFWHCTGIVVPCPHILDDDGSVPSSAMLEEKWKHGLRPGTLDGGIRSLRTAQEMIQNLKTAAGLYRKGGSSDTAQQAAVPQVKELTIEDLRELQSLIATTPPEKQAVLLKLLAQENRTIKDLEPASPVIDLDAEEPESTELPVPEACAPPAPPVITPPPPPPPLLNG
jgi:hypothetical protein